MKNINLSCCKRVKARQCRLANGRLLIMVFSRFSISLMLCAPANAAQHQPMGHPQHGEVMWGRYGVLNIYSRTEVGVFHGFGFHGFGWAQTKNTST